MTNHTNTTESIELLSSQANQSERWQPVIGEETLLFRSRLADWSEDGKNALIEEARRILARCVPPTAPNEQETGLVIGYVQSGKTKSFTALTALAHDNNYQLIIVIAGTKINLLSQSDNRLSIDLQSTQHLGKWKQFSSTEIDNNNIANTVASIRNALQRWGPNSTYSRINRQTVLITVMKQYQHLLRVITVLQQLGNLDAVPTLIIDDEADQASLNNRINQNDESTTYSRIIELRRLVPHHTFLQYTATPQALVLINLIDILSPRFAEVLTPGSNYTGGEEFFERGIRALVREIPQAHVPTRRRQLNVPPDTLLEAMRIFFIGVATGMYLDNQGRNRSMMVHPAVEKVVHAQYFNWVTRIKQDWERVLVSGIEDPDYPILIEQFRLAYEDLSRTEATLPTFAELQTLLEPAVRETIVHEINTRLSRTPNVEWNRDYSHILVGAQAMDRGYTVEGLTVTYMPRSLGNANADTVQQRARFFGYKSGYLGYCRVYLPPDATRAYQRYVEHEQDMRRQLIEFAQTGRSLRQWRRVFILDTSLSPTRRDILDNQIPIYHGDFANDWVYPHIPHDSDAATEINRRAIEAFTHSLSFTPDVRDNRQLSTHRHQIAEVSLGTIYSQLLANIQWSSPVDAVRLTALLLIVGNYLRVNPNAVCSVFLMRNGNIAKRTFTDGRVQPFQGPNPSYLGDQAFRSPSGISIQLHRIRVEGANAPVLADDVPVVAIYVSNNVSRGYLIQGNG